LTFESTADESLTDGITGLPNERAFFAVLENQIAESLRYREQRPLTIISMDIQEFGEINSRFGHVTGDDVLAFTAKTVKDQLRQMDYLARISGDEFAAILPTASEKTVKIIIDRISKSLASVGFATPSGEQLTLTLNIGSATVLVDAENAPDLFTAARTERNRNKNQRPGAVLYFPTESVS
jgi:diguanylate cyclase (GGDEF)-like protein